ncbi:TetR family transcriptional regulator C-terminal domain-containing protein [Aliamphritea hakodatensis]|uniref:TetR family transcriptional regulator C-terminal domain-containing protein n=1 Tax=Aliamphritea hakodatensis TaxID=2895352 RepID=UPI0022FDA9B8|nr:TetR family transcriptional regulator C-terminal domain-containing protein [Aliamphritea hakodatensis]
MTTTRRPFRRASEEERRTSLIEATQECIVQGGIAAVTIRRVAEFAEVTPGLVRHYFPDKNALLCEAHRATMSNMTRYAKDAIHSQEEPARDRLQLFVRTSLEAPVMQPRNHQLWTSFCSLINSVPEIAEIHREAYLEFRVECEYLVREVFAERKQDVTEDQIVRHAIAVNALIDGLWIEGCLAMDLFKSGELAELGVSSVENLLGISSV